jgi:beta-glucosidase
MSGYEPKFGMVAVDRATQRRTIKPSAAILGNIARRNALPTNALSSDARLGSSPA